MWLAERWSGLSPKEQFLFVTVVAAGAATCIVIWLQERAARATPSSISEGQATLRRVEPEELLQCLPSLGPALIPYVPRDGLDHAALAKHTRLALVGPNGCGKTREAAEIALHIRESLPRGVGLLLMDGPPGGKLPDGLLEGLEHAVVVVDDLRRGPTREPSETNAPELVEPLALDWLAEAIAWLTQRVPGRVHVIVTAAGREWEQMRRDRRVGALLDEFHEAWVPRTTEAESETYLRAACDTFGFQRPAKSVARQFARVDDGTFRPIYDYLVTLREAEPERDVLAEEQVASFERFAQGAWGETVAPSLPRKARDVMQGLSALDACGAPPARALVVPVAARVGGRVATESYRRDRETALDALAAAYIVVDPSGRVLCHESRLDPPPDGMTARQAADVALALSKVAERQPALPLLGAAFGAVVGTLHSRGAHRQALALARYWRATQPRNPNALVALGAAHLQVGGAEESGEQLEASVETFRAAARLWPKDRRPWAWAMVQNNLGVAHMALANRGEGEHLQRAAEHFGAALSVWTGEAFAHHHAVATRNLALVQ